MTWAGNLPQIHRHAQPVDPGHVTVNGSQMDPYLEGGSGHAWAALYAMWVHKYGLYDLQGGSHDQDYVSTDS